jgi:hypothetical protein
MFYKQDIIPENVMEHKLKHWISLLEINWEQNFSK